MLKSELEKEKAAHLRDHDARKNELPSVTHLKQNVNEKIPQEPKNSQFSHLTIQNQAIQQRLGTQLNVIQAFKHQQYLKYKSELYIKKTELQLQKNLTIQPLKV